MGGRFARNHHLIYRTSLLFGVVLGHVQAILLNEAVRVQNYAISALQHSKTKQVVVELDSVNAIVQVELK